MALQQLDGNVLAPMVVRSQTDIDPFLTPVAPVLGRAVGGLLGVLVAIPLAGAVTVLVGEVLAPVLRHPLPQAVRAPAAPEAGDDAARPRYIQTEWGVGYRFAGPQDQP